MAGDEGELSKTRGIIGELTAKASPMMVGGCVVVGRASGGFTSSG